MRCEVVLAAAFAACLAVGPGALAQSGEASRPAEPPPPGFTGSQYVDSAGCAFARASHGGQVTWVPRMRRDRTPICGQTPTAAPAETPAAAAAAPLPPQPAAATPRTAKVRDTAAPARRAAPAPVAAGQRGLAVLSVEDLPPGATLCPANAPRAQLYRLGNGREVVRCGSGGGKVRFVGRGDLREGALAVSIGGTTYYTPEALRGTQRLDPAPGPGAAAGPAAAGHYVQVGAYHRPANADRAAARLAEAGLPAAQARGGGLILVLAGPFGDAGEAAAAVRRARQAGFPDAYPLR